MPNLSPTGIDRRTARANNRRAAAAEQLTKLGGLPTKFIPRFWEECNQRLSVVRTINTRLAALKNDACCDSIQKDIIAQNCTFLQVVIETMQRTWAETGVIDLPVIIQATNSLVGLLKSLGLRKASKEVANLADYVEQRNKGGRPPNNYKVLRPAETINTRTIIDEDGDERIVED